MEVCRLEVLLQYMKRDINKLILYIIIMQFLNLGVPISSNRIAGRHIQPWQYLRVLQPLIIKN